MHMCIRLLYTKCDSPIGQQIIFVHDKEGEKD